MLTLHNSLTSKKEAFEPLDPKHVTMYVCGPTVYDNPHIGNARAVVVYDVLYRLLKQLYPKVTYARNITDVDDKIIKASQETGKPISDITESITKIFHDNMDALGNLSPDIEPKATEHMDAIIAMIQRLLDEGVAYESEGHVLFSVKNAPHLTSPRMRGEEVNADGVHGGGNWYYGKLSGKSTDDLISGARIAVESYKRDAEDFVLWKPDTDPNSSFKSPWGNGRPGWHIECSAMSTEYLGTDFDIHGGGADLKFPHHENEIAQSTCANPGSHFAKYWVHNGFLTVNGEKMSKSLGNFTTVQDLLDQGINGEVIRYALLSAKYNEPLDWSDKRVEDAKKALDGYYRKLSSLRGAEGDAAIQLDGSGLLRYARNDELIAPLLDNLNTPEFFSRLHKEEDETAITALQFLGFLQQDPNAWFKGGAGLDEAAIEAQITARKEAKAAKNWAEADRIRDTLTAQGIILEDKPGGKTEWRKA